MLARTLPAPTLTGAGLFVAVQAPAGDRHLLGLEGLSRATLRELLDATARERAAIARGGNRTDLAGAKVLLAFIEDSTRTRVSFEIAVRRLGGDPIAFSPDRSSLNKGETLLDTLKLFEAMGADLIVIRHACAGTPAYLAKHLSCGIINGGDGMHEHPTQGLLDLATLERAWGGRFEGRRLAIVGDLAHSRVARSAILGLTTLGAAVTVAGPATLMPLEIEALGVQVAPTLEDAMTDADGVMALRLQRERMDKGLLPASGEYARVWGVNAARVRLMKPDAVVMHPGPVNRGLEITPEVADSERSVILEQVANGVPVRCAVLQRCWAARQAAR